MSYLDFNRKLNIAGFHSHISFQLIFCSITSSSHRMHCPCWLYFTRFKYRSACSTHLTLFITLFCFPFSRLSRIVCNLLILSLPLCFSRFQPYLEVSISQLLHWLQFSLFISSMCVPPSNFIIFWAPKITVLTVSVLYSSKIEWIGNVNCCFLTYIAVLLMCLNSSNYFHIYTLQFCFILSTLDAPTSFINNFHCSRGYRAYWRHHSWTFSPSFFLSIAFKPSSACLRLFFSVCLSLSDFIQSSEMFDRMFFNCRYLTSSDVKMYLFCFSLYYCAASRFFVLNFILAHYIVHLTSSTPSLHPRSLLREQYPPVTLVNKGQSAGASHYQKVEVELNWRFKINLW